MSENEAIDRADATRKAYRSPALRSYGDLAAITQSVGKTGNSDGGNKKDKDMSAA
jgi:hypothetical protein